MMSSTVFQIFCPRADNREPLLHMSAVRRLPPVHTNNSTYIFRYAAIRLLEVEVYLDRRYADFVEKEFDDNRWTV